MTEELTIRSTDGLALEAELDAPSSVKAALVLCHPHPKMGGTMNAPLLLALRDDLVERGWAVLRFNFRGIGASEGRASTGVDEVADATGAIDAATGRYPDAPVAIAGWSFGAAVALRTALERPELAAVATIAPAVVAKPDVTAGAPAPEDFGFQGKVLVVCGENDDLVAPADVRSWAEVTGARYEEIRGANHFFWARYPQLAALVGDFLDSALS